MVSHVSINIPSHKLSRFFVLSPIDGMDYVVFIDDIIRETSTYFFPDKPLKVSTALNLTEMLKLI